MPTRDILHPLTQSRTLSRVAGYALLVGIYSFLPIWKEYSSFSEFADLPVEFHAALTLVLGWMLVFRTNTAYHRWWEARTLWGALVNACRNLAAKSHDLTTLSEPIQLEVRRLLKAFPFALRDHLRSEGCLQKIPDLEGAKGEVKHVPGFLVGRLYQAFREGRKSGQIDGDELRIIDEDLRRLLDITGGCERIYKTRIVRSYRVFARQCVFLYLVTLPWGISDGFRFWTFPLTVITAYFMLGLETVAEHVEEPFGYDEDDLDLDGLCETISVTVDEIMNEDTVRLPNVTKNS